MCSAAPCSAGACGRPSSGLVSRKMPTRLFLRGSCLRLDVPALLKSLLQCTILGTMAPSEITLEAVPSIGEVSPDDWDACASPGEACNGHGVGTSSGLPGD